MRGLLITATSKTGDRSASETSSVSAPTAAGLEQRWRLHPRVSLRPEPFGALAYHYDNRRLNFLRSPDLVELVRSLEHHETPRRAFDAQGLDESRWPSFAKALQALAASDFLLTDGEPPPSDTNDDER